MTTALLTYLPVGVIVQGGRHRPFIGLTFLFFTLVPACLALAHGQAGLVVAFLVYGPARDRRARRGKSLITSLFPAEYRARGVGLYWSWRAFAICPAPVVARSSGSVRAACAPWSAFGIGVAGSLLYAGSH
jgi:hypothetical protein